MARMKHVEHNTTIGCNVMNGDDIEDSIEVIDFRSVKSQGMKSMGLSASWTVFLDVIDLKLVKKV